MSLNLIKYLRVQTHDLTNESFDNSVIESVYLMSK
jgi:hypothetical protein